MDPISLAPGNDQTLQPALVAQTLDGLRTYFAERQHRPSPAMWEALEQLAGTLAAMAEGEAPLKLFLSSLDPGVGKTQTVSHFLRALVSAPRYVNIGAMICLGRLSEVRDVVNGLALPPGAFAVATSDEALNKLSDTPTQAAQVLITTQQRIEKQLRGLSFNRFLPLHYRGAPRQVRIWDESYLPGETLTLTSNDIARNFDLLGRWPELRTDVIAIFNEVDQFADGSIYEFPDFVSKYNVRLEDVVSLADRALDQREASILLSLWTFSGRQVSVRKDGVKGNTVLDFRDTMPTDLAPMVISMPQAGYATLIDRWNCAEGIWSD